MTTRELKPVPLLNNADLDHALDKLSLKMGDILVVDEATVARAPGLLTALTSTAIPVGVEVPIITAPKGNLTAVRPEVLLAALRLSFRSILDNEFNLGVEAAAQHLISKKVPHATEYIVMLNQVKRHGE